MESLYICRIASRLWRNQSGQDVVEYALMAGFVTVVAAAVMPSVSGSISTIFSKVSSILALI